MTWPALSPQAFHYNTDERGRESFLWLRLPIQRNHLKSTSEPQIFMPNSPRNSECLPSDAATLPSPRDWPEADVVIYDGNCVFCRGQVARLARWDGGKRLAFVSLREPLVAERFPDLSHDQLMQQMYLITRSGQRYGGAAVLRYLTRRLPRLWPLAPLLHLPFSLPVWQWCYRQVAKRRYRLNRNAKCDGACEIHRR